LFHHPARPATYTLSLHDALPISQGLWSDDPILCPVERDEAPSWDTATIDHNLGDDVLRAFAPLVDHGSVEVLLAAIDAAGQADRSEELTSELQSRFDLVCRLLLE